MTTQARHNFRNDLSGCLDLILGDEPHPAEQETIDAILALLARTPLSVILDATNHPYQTSVVAAMDVDLLDGPVSVCYTMNPPLADGTPVLVVPIPATDEAHDG